MTKVRAQKKKKKSVSKKKALAKRKPASSQKVTLLTADPSLASTGEEARKRREAVLFLIRHDIERVLDATDKKLPHLLEIWSKYRKREPFLKAMETRYSTIPTGDLLFLDVSMLQLLSKFFVQYEKLYQYLEYTQDMILALEERVQASAKEMAPLAERILVAIEAQFQEETASRLVA